MQHMRGEPLNAHSYTHAPRHQAAADQFQRAIDVFEAMIKVRPTATLRERVAANQKMKRKADLKCRMGQSSANGMGGGGGGGGGSRGGGGGGGGRNSPRDRGGARSPPSSPSKRGPSR